MSQENLEVVRRIYEATARREAETVLSLYDPEVEWVISHHPYGQMFKSGVRVGHEELRAWFRDWYEAFEEFEHECDELIEAGEHVISVGTDRGRGRQSGVKVERALAGVWTLRDGKVVRGRLVSLARAGTPSRRAAGVAALGSVFVRSSSEACCLALVGR